MICVFSIHFMGGILYPMVESGLNMYLSVLIMLMFVLIPGKYLSYGNLVVTAVQVVAGGAVYFGLLLLMKDNMLIELINTVLGILKRGVRKNASD